MNKAHDPWALTALLRYITLDFNYASKVDTKQFLRITLKASLTKAKA